MRLQQLSLERFGHFEGCQLTFRGGGPDLHIVYGANEAGKSTSMAAVSDLLFGFLQSSPYRFRFGYPLLRIGATLEEDGRVIPVRRRKAHAGSLVDAADRPIDDGPLVAMLHGQTRDSFRLAFSLDHRRLREGGQAIVQAKDDVGQALFAASSGMTDISAALADIEAEAEAIWAPRAAKHRTFTQAERIYDASQSAERKRRILPKAWTDARMLLSEAEQARRRAECERDELVQEQRRLERLRRVGPAIQRRAELLARITSLGGISELQETREQQIIGALQAADEAERRRAAASSLLEDVEAKIAAVTDDPKMLDAAEAVEALTERCGAIAKAQLDARQMSIERNAKQARIADILRDLRMPAPNLPSRSEVARLRALAQAHGEALAAMRSLGQLEEDLQAKHHAINRRLADSRPTSNLGELTRAIDAARRLGENVDAHCLATKHGAHRARTAAIVAREKLAPWTGDLGALRRLPGVAEQELASTDAELEGWRNTSRLEAAEAQRLADASEQMKFERDALANSGQAVSEIELVEARRLRDAWWRRLREHVSGADTLVDVCGAIDVYRRAVEQTDRLADRRFAFAEESGKLALLDKQCADVELRQGQAEARRETAKAGGQALFRRWCARLIEAGLPPLPPVRLRAWLVDRAAALEAEAHAEQLTEQAATDTAQVHALRVALTRLMPKLGLEGETLAPVLREAERRRADAEDKARAFRDGRAESCQLADALDRHRRQTNGKRDERAQAENAWNAAQEALGLTLDISQADTCLALLDELKSAVDRKTSLSTSLEGIETDRMGFEADLGTLWMSLGGVGAPSLDQLRSRLREALATARELKGLRDERQRRHGEVKAALATQRAAMASLAPVLVELGDVAPEALYACVEASSQLRAYRRALAAAEAEVICGGDGHALQQMVAQWSEIDPDAVAARTEALAPQISAANERVSAAADAVGEARRAFTLLNVPGNDAAMAAAEAEQARAEMGAQVEGYLLKRTQAVTLRWALERFRQQRQDPLLARAGALFRRLTLEQYAELRIDFDVKSPRLLAVRDDGRQAIDAEAMSDGTADQLFLALRLAAAEQSIAAGVRLPFLADDLFINFDDERARVGFEVLADFSRATQVLFFTHHKHLSNIACEVVGADRHSECTLTPKSNA